MVEIPSYISPNEFGKIDPNELTLEQLKSGEFGFTDDIEAISDPELRRFMEKTDSYFDRQEREDGFIPSAPILNQFSSYFSTPIGNIRQQLEPLRSGRHLNLIKGPYGLCGERIELEAAMAYLKVRQMVLRTERRNRVNVEEVIGETINKLGSYYVVVPLFPKGGEHPKYLINISLHEAVDSEDEKIREFLKTEEIEDMKSPRIEKYIPKIDEETERELESLNAGMIIHKIELTRGEMGKMSEIDSVDGQISWANLLIGWNTGRVLEFILRADNHELYKYNKWQIGISLKELDLSFQIGLKYFAKHPDIQNLRHLFEGVKWAVRKNPEKFLGQP